MAKNNGLIMLVIAATGLYLFKDQLFATGIGQGNASNEPQTNTNQNTNVSGLKEYLAQVVATDPHIVDGKTDKYYWWYWIKKFKGIEGDPPLPLELTYYGDDEQLSLDTVIFRMEGNLDYGTAN